MSAERFHVKVTPQPEFPGAVQELLLRAHIGRKIHEERIAQKQKFADEFRAAGIEEYARQEEAEIPELEYVLDLRDRISKSEKEGLFAPAIEGMRQVAARRGLALPEDLLSRIFILDGKTYDNLYRQEKGARTEPEEAIGTVLRNNICIINYDEIVKISEKKKIARDRILRACGIHELWHSLSYRERWVPEHSSEDMFSEASLNRRGGILTRRPGRKYTISGVVKGLSCLEEGFTEFLNRESLRYVGERDLPLNPYTADLEVVEGLMKRIGEEPFFQATFTKNGFRMLHTTLENTYGRFALYREINKRHRARLYGWNVDTYKKLVEKHGRRVMLRNQPDLKMQYPNNALRHIALLMGIETSSVREGTKKRYEETLRFITGVEPINQPQKPLDSLRNILPAAV